MNHRRSPNSLGRSLTWQIAVREDHLRLVILQIARRQDKAWSSGISHQASSPEVRADQRKGQESGVECPVSREIRGSIWFGYARTFFVSISVSAGRSTVHGMIGSWHHELTVQRQHSVGASESDAGQPRWQMPHRKAPSVLPSRTTVWPGIYPVHLPASNASIGWLRRLSTWQSVSRSPATSSCSLLQHPGQASHMSTGRKRQIQTALPQG